jgi:hypothetical protein
MAARVAFKVLQAKLPLSSTQHKPQPYNSMPQPHVSPSHCAQDIMDHCCRCGFIHKLWFHTQLTCHCSTSLQQPSTTTCVPQVQCDARLRATHSHCWLSQPTSQYVIELQQASHCYQPRMQPMPQPPLLLNMPQRRYLPCLHISCHSGWQCPFSLNICDQRCHSQIFF